MRNQPDLVAHADWGSSASKRALAVALRSGEGYRMLPPRLVIEPGSLLAELAHEAGPNGGLLIGFDFPIGLPLRFAQQIGVEYFPGFLCKLGQGEWRDFYQVAATSSEISLHRPFYPNRTGESRQSHLLQALGVACMDDLRRQCEKSGIDEYGVAHRAACPLFWTMGGQQVGKAAILGWKETLEPAVFKSQKPIFWPFDGDLDDLLGSDRTVIAETYPAEFYHHLRVSFSKHKAGMKTGKRVQAERLGNAARLLDWAANAPVEVDEALQADLRNGFGNSPSGEDRFDAVVGLMGMLNILLGKHACCTPQDEQVRKIEGWIMGRHLVPKERSGIGSEDVLMKGKSDVRNKNSI